jgi:hypothetical protein
MMSAQRELMMANKATFSTDEWNQVLGGVFMAGFAVTVADLSNLWGLFKETIASGRALMEAKSSASANGLMKGVVNDMERAEGRAEVREYVKTCLDGIKRENIRARAIEEVRKAVAIVEQKAPIDAAAFKEWLLHISTKVAEASKEGGFLGFGGIAVSDAEKATLSEIANALQLKT